MKISCIKTTCQNAMVFELFDLRDRIGFTVDFVDFAKAKSL